VFVIFLFGEEACRLVPEELTLVVFAVRKRVKESLIEQRLSLKTSDLRPFA